MEGTEKRGSSLAPIASWNLILLFLWGSLALLWMPVGVHWKWLSFGFVFAFSGLFFLAIRQIKTRKEEEPISLPAPSSAQTLSSTQIDLFEKERNFLQQEVVEKSAHLRSLQEELTGLKTTQTLLVKERDLVVEEKQEELRRLQELLSQKEEGVKIWEKRYEELQQKNDDLRLEIETLLATDDSKEEKELFFFFSEEEATHFLVKKQKEAYPFLQHSLSALQGWVENEKEGFLLLFSSEKEEMLASNLPLFPLLLEAKGAGP